MSIEATKLLTSDTDHFSMVGSTFKGSILAFLIAVGGDKSKASEVGGSGLFWGFDISEIEKLAADEVGGASVPDLAKFSKAWVLLWRSSMLGKPRPGGKCALAFGSKPREDPREKGKGKWRPASEGCTGGEGCWAWPLKGWKGDSALVVSPFLVGEK